MKSQAHIDAMLIKEQEELYKPILYNILITLAYHEEWDNVIDCEIRGEKLIPMKTFCPPYPTSEEIGPWLREDNILTSMWLQRNGITVTPEQVYDAVRALALIKHNLDDLEGDIFIGAR